MWRRTVAGTVMTLAGTTAGLVNSTRTLLGDQIGSVDAVADLSSGGLVERADYAAFGAMRTALSAVVVGVAPLTTTTRGFTGQEQLATLDLVHLNGRIYDPQLGRFLQADLMVAQPYNPQNWNPYSYVFNNPLANTDPTGMFSIRQALGMVIGIVFAFISQQYWALGNILAAFATATAGGFLSGVVSTGSLKQGVIGAFEAGLTLGIGGSGWNTLEQIGANAVTGGVMSVLSGGKFGNGFVSAGLTCAAMPLAGNSSDVVVRSVEGALIGGTISEATGGKFVNGAISGAVQGAMEEPQTAASDSSILSCSDGKPAQDDWTSDAVNTSWRDSGKVWYSDGILHINLTVSGPYAKELAASTENSWNNASGDYNGQSYKVDAHFSVVKSGGDWQIVRDMKLVNADLTCNGTAYVVGSNAHGSVEYHIPPISQYANEGTPLSLIIDGAPHEFGHALGLTHAPPSSGSIMSYDPSRVVTGRDIFNVSKLYYRAH